MRGLGFRRRAGKTGAITRRPPVLTVEPLEDRRVLSGFLPGLADVSYHGGPLLQNVQIESVFAGQAWSTDAILQPLVGKVNGFLQYFPTSPYINVLKQYNVGPGSFLGDLVIPQVPAGQTLDDSAIRQALDTAIGGKQLAAPTGNQLYVFFTAPGVTVTHDQQSSASDFVGYHDTFTDSAGAAVDYAVIPYPTGGLANVLLADFQQMTVVLSHEIVEGITDPDTQTGWFDQNNREISDLAVGRLGVLGGYEIQGVWSQAAQAVVVPSDAGPTPLLVRGVPVEATAGQAFTATVAVINGAPAGSQLTASIDWGNGTTTDGTVTADPGGGFDVTGSTTYASAGAYQVTVTINDPTGAVVGTALTRAKVEPAGPPGPPIPPVPTLFAWGTPVDTTAGQQFTGVVAHFKDTGTSTAGDFTASIDWGDGTSSAGTITPDPTAGYDVTGSHTYAPWADPGPVVPLGPTLGSRFFVLTVDIQKTGTPDSVVFLNLAHVAPAPPVIAAKGQNIHATSGQPFTGTVATFTTAIAGAQAGDFTAMIDWGDGTSSAGTVVPDPSGSGFDVTGTHTYTTGTDFSGIPEPTPGSRLYLVSVAITDAKTGDQGHAESLAEVAPAPPSLTVTGDNIRATFNQVFTGTVATLTDTNPSTAGDFTAMIDWGDGTSSAGTVVPDPSGSGFDVSGSHTYQDLFANPLGRPGVVQDPLAYRLTVVVKDTTHPAVGFGHALAIVVAQPPSVTVSGTEFNAVFGQAFTGTVATFTTTDTNPSASGFTATIDWGDGTSSAGTVVPDPGGGGFDVTGTHTYTDDILAGRNGPGTLPPVSGPGPGVRGELYFVAVTVQDTTTNTAATGVSLAHVTPKPPAIVVTGQTLALTAGAVFTGTVATFTDTDTTGTTAFAATIDWGDGTVTAGSVAPSGGTFSVTGAHAYADGGTYPVLVRVRDFDGNAGLGLGAAVVTDTGPPPTPALAWVSEAFLHSAEHFADVIIQDYQQYLQRTPGPAEVAGWVHGMQVGLSDTQVLAAILSSQEFFTDAGGTAQAWLGALYQALLGRAPDFTGERSFLLGLDLGISEDAIAQIIANSPEREAHLVQGYYQQYLGRTAAAPEVAGWVTAYQLGVSNDQIVADFLSSTEYYQKHNDNARDWLSSAYENILSRRPDLLGYDGWLGALN